MMSYLTDSRRVLPFLAATAISSVAFGVHPWQAIVGPYPRAFACSGNGSVVVGAFGGGAFRWTSDLGMEDLGQIPGRQRHEARAVSPDATAIVGWSSPDNGVGISSPRAFRWTRTGGISDLPNLPGGDFAIAWGVSGYGTIVVGQGMTSTNSSRAVMWVNAGTPQQLIPDDGIASLAYAVNADGSVVAGSHGGNAFRWTAADGMVEIAFGNSAAYAVSTDGSFVVGLHGSRAFRWSASAGLQDLGLLSPTDQSSVAMGVSADGESVVGESWGKVFIWTAATGMRDLLADVDVPNNLRSPSQPSISADATVATVLMHDESGAPVSLVIRLIAPCRADFNGDGQVDFFDYLDFVDAFSIGC